MEYNNLGYMPQKSMQSKLFMEISWNVMKVIVWGLKGFSGSIKQGCSQEMRGFRAKITFLTENFLQFANLSRSVARFLFVWMGKIRSGPPKPPSGCL